VNRASRLLLTLALVALPVCGSAWAAAPEADASWAKLTPAQKQVLAPLEREWATIDSAPRAKWLEVAARFPAMSAEERARVQARMAEWGHLSSAERSRARLQFYETRQVPADERQAKWQAYQALSPEERRALAQRAKPAPAVAADVAAAPGAAKPGAGKSNLVQSAPAARAQVVTPTTKQSGSGATTTTMSNRAAPPAHHQTGLPKIAATPGFVDSSTLLPKRGPQGAAVRSAAAASSEPAAQP
jgi:hypothetical protein